ncbi:SulP family inorganic anion transporter [Paracoccus sp. Z330]|uniref:SulP family inorganic anion transporter n=1 Tax=Paracoccus onchidii TaxID=3017813 RepID=A0ABT4ZHH7_9RHOB|nr:SulP family inorganic anion transporter [Paracoccus onchidii]MDB6178433.1 SulP family inorganic anion transporter [Paracoccus onchidii]
MRQLAKYFALPRPWFRKVNAHTLRADATAGLTNAAVVLPQGVAFAVIAGLPPQYGLFTAMIPSLVAALFGSSMVMVSGPTTAISAVLFASLSQFAPAGTPAYIQMALVLTVMVGAIQLAAGLARLGALIGFVSHSVIVGFTAAAAVLIAVSQLAPALGVTVEKGGGVLERFLHLIDGIGGANGYAVLLAGVTLATLIAVQRWNRRLPSYLIALGVGSLCGWWLDASAQGIAMFAALPILLPTMHLPSVEMSAIAELTPAAVAIAFVALLEAMSIGRDFAHRRGEPYDSNQEIMGQGLSNLFGGMFQCYAGSGSFTRSALNAESGAQTPMSSIFAACFLFVMMLGLAPFVAYVPVPVVAGIILFVAYRLVDMAEIRHILGVRTSDRLVLLVTFLAGISIELEFAIVAGVLTSLFAFLRKSATPLVAVLAPSEEQGHRSLRGAIRYNLSQCPQIAILRIEGPIYFASLEAIEDRFQQIEQRFGARSNLVLYLRGVGLIDLAGADYLISLIRRHRARGGNVRIVATYEGVVSTLRRTHVLEVLGAENLVMSKNSAISACVRDADPEICRNCTSRVFQECRQPTGV